MPSIRTTRNKFNELIDNLNKVKDGLNAEIRAANREIEGYRGNLKDGIAFATPELTADIIARLDRASATAKTGRDFGTMTIGLVQDDQATEAKIDALQKKWTSPADTIATRDAKDTELVNLKKTIDATDKSISTINDARKDIDHHNMRHIPTITPQTMHAFTPLNRWKFVTDKVYRSGYIALRDYVAVNKNFTEDCTQLEKNTQAKAALSAAKTSLKGEIMALDNHIAEMNSLQAEIKREQGNVKGLDGILDTIRDTALHLCLENPNFAAALATELGQPDGEKIAVPALKIRTLERSVAGLEAHNAGIEQTRKKLAAPMAKLNKGVRHVPNKTIKIDLDGIEKGVNQQLASAKTISVNANGFRSSVSSYTPAYTNDSSFYFLQNYLLMDMLLSHNDHTYCHNTIGVPQSSTDTFNKIAVPDVSTDVQNVPMPSADFNVVAPDVNVPDTQLNVPDISVPDVSVPDVSIPDVQVEIPTINVDIPTITVDIPSINVDTSFTIDPPSISFDP